MTILALKSAAVARDRLRNGAVIGAIVGCGAAVCGMAGSAAAVTASDPIWGGDSTGALQLRLWSVPE